MTRVHAAANEVVDAEANDLDAMIVPTNANLCHAVTLNPGTIVSAHLDQQRLPPGTNDGLDEMIVDHATTSVTGEMIDP
jgi:hypothetical protein